MNPVQIGEFMAADMVACIPKCFEFSNENPGNFVGRLEEVQPYCNSQQYCVVKGTNLEQLLVFPSELISNKLTRREE